MEQEAERFKAKYIAIGRNIERKAAREANEAKLDEEFDRGRKFERKQLARERGREEWYWKRRVFSVETVFAIAFSVVTLKALEIVITQLHQ